MGLAEGLKAGELKVEVSFQTAQKTDESKLAANEEKVPFIISDQADLLSDIINKKSGDNDEKLFGTDD